MNGRKERKESNAKKMNRRLAWPKTGDHTLLPTNPHGRSREAHIHHECQSMGVLFAGCMTGHSSGRTLATRRAVLLRGKGALEVRRTDARFIPSTTFNLTFSAKIVWWSASIVDKISNVYTVLSYFLCDGDVLSTHVMSLDLLFPGLFFNIYLAMGVMHRRGIIQPQIHPARVHKKTEIVRKRSRHLL